jgi:hypothetical protein
LKYSCIFASDRALALLLPTDANPPAVRVSVFSGTFPPPIACGVPLARAKGKSKLIQYDTCNWDVTRTKTNLGHISDLFGSCLFYQTNMSAYYRSHQDVTRA